MTRRVLSMYIKDIDKYISSLTDDELDKLQHAIWIELRERALKSLEAKPND